MEIIWHKFHIRLQQYPSWSLHLLSWVLAGWFSVLSTRHSPSCCWFGQLIPVDVVARLLCCGHHCWPAWTCCWPPCRWAWKQEGLSQPSVDPRVRLWSTTKPTEILFQPPELFKYKQVTPWSCPKLWPSNGIQLCLLVVWQMWQILSLAQGGLLAAHQAGVRCEGDGKRTHAACKNNCSSVQLVQAQDDLHVAKQWFFRQW